MKLGSIAFAGAILLVGAGYEWMALKMPRGTFAYPGPGLYPMIVGLFLMATALGCLVQELRHAAPAAVAPAPAAAPERRNARTTWQLTALTAGYILLLKPLGYPICICAFLAVAIRIFGFRRWLATAVLSAVIAVTSYVAFVVWLKVPLPLGVLEELLG